MTAQRGKDLLLKIGDGSDPEHFESVGGIRTRTLSLNAQSVDITHSSSPGGWRELLSGGGVRQADISGNGVFLSDASARKIQAVFFSVMIRNWKIVVPGLGEISGPFQVTNLDYTGNHDGEATVALALQSAGEIVFI